MMPMLDNMRRSNSKGDKMTEPKMPRPVGAVPPPAMPPAPAMPAPRPLERVYDEEVLRRYQNDLDRERMMAALESDRDDWRRKALTAQDECRRLEQRLAQQDNAHQEAMARLTEDRDRKVDELTARRDEYKLRLARFETKIGVQGQAVIDLANGISKTILETMDELKGERGVPDVAGAAGLAAIAEAVEEELPRVVTAGPAQHN